MTCGKRVSFGEFVDKSNNKHNGKYEYHEESYIKVNSPTKITCPLHGDFIMTPYEHMKGHGCPLCANERIKEKALKRNLLKFLERSMQIFGNRFEYPNIEKDYKGKNIPITIKCRKCGNIFQNKTECHLHANNGGCQVCNALEKEKEPKKKGYTYEEVITYNKSGYEIKPYDGRLQRLDKCTLVCPIHGEYKCRIMTITKGGGKCRKCIREPKVTFERFKTKFEELYRDKLECDFSKFVSVLTPMRFKCKDCGCVFERKPYDMINPHYRCICPNCSLQIRTKERTKTQEQFIKDLEDRFGESAFDVSELVYVKSSANVTLKCNKCGRTFTMEANHLLRSNGCPYHHFNKSVGEEEIASYVKSLSNDVITNSKNILSNHGELDIYVPKYKFAIEYNGLYWHSDVKKGNPKYHLSKTLECEKEGISLFHVFEDEWIDKPTIVKSIIRYHLHTIADKVYAKNCTTKEIHKEEMIAFLATNSLYGKEIAERYYGLFDENEMVYGIGIDLDDNSQLIRIGICCPIVNKIVVGGLSKLIKYAIRQLHPTKVVVEADRRMGLPSIFENIGFVRKAETEPSYWYTDSSKRYSTPLNNKCHKIYDCGKIIYELWIST